MKKRIYETISRFQIGPLTIRIWCQADPTNFMGFAPARILPLIAEWKERAEHDHIVPVTPQEMRDKLADVSGVSAVEITTEIGIGILAYNDWP